MTTEAMIENLGLDENASPSEIQSSIEDKQSELEYLITATDDKSLKREYYNKIKELKLVSKVISGLGSIDVNAEIPKNLHHLPLSGQSNIDIKAANHAAIKAKMSGRQIEDLAVEEIELEAIPEPIRKPQPKEIITKPKKKSGSALFAVVAVVILVSGGTLALLVDNGTLSMSLTTSKEQALEIASVEMIKGEVNSYHQLLANAKAKIELELNKLPFDTKINKNAIKALMNTAVIIEMQGKVSMGDSLLGQGHYVEATDTYNTIKERSKLLLSEYNAASNIISSSIILNEFESSWAKLQNSYELTIPTEVVAANDSVTSAYKFLDNKDFSLAFESMQGAIDNWQVADAEIKYQIEQIGLNKLQKDLELAEQERVRQLNIEIENRLELEREVNELERLAEIEANELAQAQAEAQAVIDLELARIAQIKEADRLSLKLTPATMVQPTYPNYARRLQIEGWVDFEFTVQSSGVLKDLVITGANPPRVFNKAAITAFKQWTFSPLLKNGESIERLNAKYRVRFMFEG